MAGPDPAIPKLVLAGREPATHLLFRMPTHAAIDDRLEDGHDEISSPSSPANAAARHDGVTASLLARMDAHRDGRDLHYTWI